MEVRPGYKESLTGLLPMDWDVQSIGTLEKLGLVKLFRGKVISKEDIRRTPGDFPIYSSSVHNDGLFGRYGLFMFDEELITWSIDGGGHFFHRPCHKFSVTNVCGYLRVSERIDSQYLASQLQHLHGRKFFDYQLKAHPSVIRGAYSVPIPSMPEQRAIATALSDVDALLGGLDRLIAKKRDLKQAAMQQLLTGQTRLPGFNGEWVVKRLGDHVTFLKHGVNSRAELVPEGRVKYLHYGDVHACKDVYLSPASLPCLPEAKAASLDRLLDGDLVLADASEDVAGVSKSVEIRGVGNTELVSGLHTIAARFDRDVLADGFKGFLQHCPQFSSHLRRLAAGTKVYSTGRAHVGGVEMRLPSVAEQIAIAAVLSDMDAELGALQARRNKTRDLKQAMMQELLTGRTRLV